MGKAVAGRPHRQSHIHAQTSLGESRGPTWTTKPWVSAQATKDSKPQFEEKICGDCGGGRNSQTHRRVCWRDPQGPKMSTNPPTCKSAPKGHHMLVGSEGSDGK